jgi:protein-S-isoprenylcysteine O-methyltransferase Ste14
MKKRIKLHGILMFISLVAIGAFPKIFFRSQKAGKLDFIIQILGIGFILLGQLLRVSARGYKAEHSGQGVFLLRAGPYSLVRNPMYLGILFIGAGIILILFKWWVAAVFLLFFLIGYMRLIFKEEKKLSEAFGREYQDYCRTTPRLFPNPAALFIRNIGEIFPLRWAWFKKEIISIVLVLGFVIAGYLIKWFS